jgi:hypothetical protein
MSMRTIDQFRLSRLEHGLRTSDPDYVRRLESIAAVLLPPSIPENADAATMPDEQSHDDSGPSS